MSTVDVKTRANPSLWDAFTHPVFTTLWVATVVSNVGDWMYNAAAGWLMTSLNPDPRVIAAVAVTGYLPYFLLALPAGALTDIIDKRRLLIAAAIASALLSAAFATLVSLKLITPGLLLLFNALITTAAAMTYPTWQAIVPLLVPRKELTSAVAANSAGVNVSRAIGPALGGFIIAAFGIAWPFWLDAISGLAVVGALLWWKTPSTVKSSLPAERFGSAVVAGVRYAANSPPLRAAMVRAVAFFLFASAYWALLPLVARQQIAGGPQLYGVLLGMIGAGAVAGAFLLPLLRARVSTDSVVAIGTLGTALAMLLYAVARTPLVGLLASALAGICWIVPLAMLNVSAQTALPDWVRGRGLAMYVTVMFGSLTLGSAIWGQVANLAGLSGAHLIAAAGAVLAIPLTWRWKLQRDAHIDLMPSGHWPAPLVAEDLTESDPPVMVSITYQLGREEDRDAYLAGMERLSRERRRDGAYAWGLFQDAADPALYEEVFFVASWTEHLRQHERVTNADRVVQQDIDRFLATAPVVRHLLGKER